MNFTIEPTKICEYCFQKAVVGLMIEQEHFFCLIHADETMGFASQMVPEPERSDGWKKWLKESAPLRVDLSSDSGEEV